MSTAANNPDPELKRMIDQLDRQVRESDANNSSVYAFLEKRADLETLAIFMNWDGEQPAFNVYLKRWLDKVPSCVKAALADHIREEEEEEHARLFCQMLDHLNETVEPHVQLDQRVLRELNYTFSKRCADEHDAAFFAGGFLATEIMSAKRCAQVLAGLRRLGVDSSELRYLHLHSEGDIRHVEEVKDRFVRPMLENDPQSIHSIRRGVQDRLDRSNAYLSWYERHVLGHVS